MPPQLQLQHLQRRDRQEQQVAAPLGSRHSSRQTIQRKPWMRVDLTQSGNAFLDLILEFERPARGRLYAAIEVPNPDANPYIGPDGTREPLHYECVDADWLEALLQGNDRPAWYDVIVHAPLYVVEYTEGETLPPFPSDVPSGGIAWYQIDYAQVELAEANARLYQSLFDDGIPVRVDVRPSEFPGRGGAPARVKDPYEWLAHEVLPPAELTIAELTGLFEAVDTRSGVAVYDVGQGAFQAALGSHGRPSMYVDMGGGVLYNRRSFPGKTFTGICVSDRPPVVLSHWDWDHWSSGALFSAALDLTWIAPPVPQTPIQASFAAKLRTRGNLRTWPASLPMSVRMGSVQIEKCTGTTSNDSGLAVTLRPSPKSRKKALLPGDAAYAHIPSVLRGQGTFSAMCLSHHGGKLHTSTYPAGTTQAICANSAGPRNTYGHPLFSTIEKHLAERWAPPLPTGYSGQRPCHVLLPWSGPPEMFRGGCERSECSVARHDALPVRLTARTPSKKRVAETV